MQETELYRYWEFYNKSGDTIFWDNNSLKILDCGDLNEHSGPDFQFACFQFNGIVYHGAVEFHLEIDDWYRHNHHRDPAYGDVVLHVLARQPGKTKYVKHLASGRSIPAFVLPKPVHSVNKNRCVKGKKLSPARIKGILQELALQRLDLKVQSYAKSLKSYSEHAVFYSHFFRVLGYPFNKNSFELLAQKIPLHIFEAFKNKPVILMAIYFGCAGFLQGSYNDIFAIRLQKLYSHYQASLSCSILHPSQWQMSAVRPLNHPHFRIAAWIAFLLSLQNKAPFTVIYHQLQQRLEYREAYQLLQALLSIKTRGYWRDHYALDKSLKDKKNDVYLGPARINELLSNLIIPLSIAQANKGQNPGFSSYLKDFYLWMPGKSGYGSFFRKQPWLMEYQNIWQSCNTGQALLHLNNVYCSVNQCAVCPLGRKIQG